MILYNAFSTILRLLKQILFEKSGELHCYAKQYIIIILFPPNCKSQNAFLLVPRAEQSRRDVSLRMQPAAYHMAMLIDILIEAAVPPGNRTVQHE